MLNYMAKRDGRKMERAGKRAGHFWRSSGS